MSTPQSNLGSKSILHNSASKPFARLLLSHGAGAPMDSIFMSEVAQKLAFLGVDVIRFEFDYMASRRTTGKKRPPPPVAQICTEWENWMNEIHTNLQQLPLFIGGKSMGGRVASMLDCTRLAKVNWHGVICLGYPFHPQKKPEKLRIEHLQTSTMPTLIIQGTKDSFGSISELEQYPLSSKVAIHWINSANHDLRPLKKSGISAEQALNFTAEKITDFIRQTTPNATTHRASKP